MACFEGLVLGDLDQNLLNEDLLIGHLAEIYRVVQRKNTSRISKKERKTRRTGVREELCKEHLHTRRCDMNVLLHINRCFQNDFTSESANTVRMSRFHV